MPVFTREVSEAAHGKSAYTPSGFSNTTPELSIKLILDENLHKEPIVNCGEIHRHVKMEVQQKGSTILEVNILMISL